ncbi:MAG: MaoC family dehydratase [Bryobacteraceae bacterium]
MPPRVISDIDELNALTGQEVAAGDWLEVTQDRINQFAGATGDHQWIHVDVARATRELGAPIAHGFLTLSLIPALVRTAITFAAPFRLTLNYGLNRVRFTHTVRASSRVRARMFLLAVTEIEGGWQVAWRVTVEIEGVDKPACVAETLSRHLI